VSSEKKGGTCSANKQIVPEGAKDKEEAEVTSVDKDEASAHGAIVFLENFIDPTDLTSVPKAYATKFFHKLTEAKKWELQQDPLNTMMRNAWDKADAQSSEIEKYKKDSCDFSTSFSASAR
jgi:hypothetical protein